MNSTHILVVDDEPDIRELVKDILEDEGYGVTSAQDGGSAREVLRARRLEDENRRLAEELGCQRRGKAIETVVLLVTGGPEVVEILIEDAVQSGRGNLLPDEAV